MNTWLLKKSFVVFVLVTMVSVFLGGQIPNFAFADGGDDITVNLWVEGFAVDNDGTDATVLPLTKVSLPRGSTALDALAVALNSKETPFVLSKLSFGEYISSINGQAEGKYGGYDGWSFRVNGESPPVGASEKILANEDSVVFYYGDWEATHWPTVAVEATSNGETPSTFKLVLKGEDGEGIAQGQIVVYSDWEATDVVFIGETDAHGELPVNLDELESKYYYLQFWKYTTTSLSEESAAKPGFPEIVKSPLYMLTIDRDENEISLDEYVPDDLQLISYSLMKPTFDQNASIYYLENEQIAVSGMGTYGLTVEAKLQKNGNLISSATDIANNEYSMVFNGIDEAGAYSLELATVVGEDKSEVVFVDIDVAVPVVFRIEGDEDSVLGSTEVMADTNALDSVNSVLEGQEPKIELTIKDSDWGRFIYAIGGIENGKYGGYDGWQFMVKRGGEFLTPNGAESFYPLKNDEIVFYYGDSYTRIPQISFTPKYPLVNEPIKISVTSEWSDWEGGTGVERVANVKILFNYGEYFTDQNGQVTLPAVEMEKEYSLSVSKEVYGSIPAIVRNGDYKFYVYENPPASIPTPVITSITYDKDSKKLNICGEGESGFFAVIKFRGQYAETKVANGSFSFQYANVEAGEWLLEVYLRDSEGLQGDSIKKPLTILRGVDLTSTAIEGGVKEAVRYLKSRQKEDGNLYDFAAVALSLAGENVESIKYGDNNHLSFLLDNINSEEYQSTTGIAKAILAIIACKADPRNFAERDLVCDLLERQDRGSGHFGAENESTQINSHIWAIITLETVGGLDYDREKAKTWLQNNVKNGLGWGWDTGQDSDPDTTSAVIGALSLLGENTASEIIVNALNYLSSLQSTNGGIIGWDGKPNVYTTIEVAKALLQLGINPLTGVWQQEGGNPISYILAQQKGNGAIDDNVAATAGALEVLFSFNQNYAVTGSGGQDNPGGGTSEKPTSINITLKVVGKNNSTLLSERRLTLYKEDEYGFTPLGALERSGLNYDIREESNGIYVCEIEGVAEDILLGSTAGWKYAVNDYDSGSSADSYQLKEGDKVIWYWAKDYRDSGPGGNSETLDPPQLTEEEQEAKKAAEQKSLQQLKTIKEELAGVFDQDIPETAFIEVAGQRVLVVGADNVMSLEEREYLQQLFMDNVVRETQEAKALKDNVIEDEQGEVRLNIAAGALLKDTKISVNEQSGGPKVPITHKRIGSVYDFGPSGLLFEKDIQVSLPLIYEGKLDPKNIVLAWYDEDKEAWIAIPAVVDLTNGRVTGLLRHFTKVAVLLKEKESLVFTDLPAWQFPWAIREVSHLSALGVVNGLDKDRFAPNLPVTRAQFTKMIVEALDLPESSAQVDFSDTQKNQWYYSYLQRGSASGLVQGNADGTFKPDAPVTRQEMAVMISRALSDSKAGNGVEFADAGEIASWAKDAVEIAAGAGLIKGFEDGAFKPADLTTRAQSAVVIYRLLSAGYMGE